MEHLQETSLVEYCYQQKSCEKPKQIELEGPPKQNFNRWIPKANILIILDAKRGCWVAIAILMQYKIWSTELSPLTVC